MPLYSLTLHHFKPPCAGSRKAIESKALFRLQLVAGGIKHATSKALHRLTHSNPVAMAPDPPTKEVAVYTVVSIVCEVVYDVC